jgi:hypothetical protein
MGRYRAAVDGHLVLPAQVRLTRGAEHARHLAGLPPRPAVPVRLIIDTGSGRSSLIPTVIAQMEAPAHGVVRVATSLAAVEANLHWVRLEFPGTSLRDVAELSVARLPLPPSLQGFHGVIGRDLLSRWHSLLYEGSRGRLTIRDTPGGLFGWLRR